MYLSPQDVMKTLVIKYINPRERVLGVPGEGAEPSAPPAPCTRLRPPPHCPLEALGTWGCPPRGTSPWCCPHQLAGGPLLPSLPVCASASPVPRAPGLQACAQLSRALGHWVLWGPAGRGWSEGRGTRLACTDPMSGFSLQRPACTPCGPLLPAK